MDCDAMNSCDKVPMHRRLSDDASRKECKIIDDPFRPIEELYPPKKCKKSLMKRLPPVIYEEFVGQKNENVPIIIILIVLLVFITKSE